MKRNYGNAYTAPIAIWTVVFFIIPILIIFFYSFLKKGLYGGVEPVFSLAAYTSLANPVFAKVALTTLRISATATIITVLIALPCAYFMAGSRFKTFLLFLVIIPFWTNFLIRIYAWIAILGNNGFLNDILMRSGLTSGFTQFMYNRWAVILVLVYTYIPFAILPLYSTIEKFDFSLLEAARDLGASQFRAIRSILLPNIRGGIITAVLFTFIPTFGAYAVPQLVGGKDSLMLGNIIARELTVTRNWPLAASISMVITIITTVSLLVFMRKSPSGGTSSSAAGRSKGGERSGKSSDPQPVPSGPRGNLR